MKAKQKKALFSFVIAFMLSLFLSFTTVNSINLEEDKGINCSGIPGLCIEAYANSYTDSAGSKKSSFMYPSFRQGDYLRIDEIRIYSGKEEIYVFGLYTNVFPEKSHTPGTYSENYGEQFILIDLNLSENDIYTIKRTTHQNYAHYLNDKKVKDSTLYNVELYKPSEWIFQLEPRNQLGQRDPQTYTILKEGRWRGDVFYVGSRHEMNSLVENKKAVKVSIIAFIFFLVFTIFQIWKNEIGDLLTFNRF